jgi:hypothetical protein
MNPDREILRTRKRILICGIEREKRIMDMFDRRNPGIEREVERMKKELAQVEKQLEAFKTENERISA